MYKYIENIILALSLIDDLDKRMNLWRIERENIAWETCEEAHEASPDELLNMLIDDYRFRDTILDFYGEERTDIVAIVDKIIDISRTISPSNLPRGVFEYRSELAKATIEDERWRALVENVGTLKKLLERERE